MMNLSLCWALAQLDAHQVIIGMKNSKQLKQNLSIEKSLEYLPDKLLEEFRNELV